jgi:hypothetical protein
MSQIIIYTDPTKGVVVISPSSDASITQIQTDTVPAGLDSEIVEVSALPSDCLFRGAWEWAGIGQPITENLATVKTIAHAFIRQVALKATTLSNEETAIGETPTYEVAAISTDYTAAKAAITADKTRAAIAVEMDAFASAYTVST